jgi:hypothetical protein
MRGGQRITAGSSFAPTRLPPTPRARAVTVCGTVHQRTPHGLESRASSVIPIPTPPHLVHRREIAGSVNAMGEGEEEGTLLSPES